MVFNELKHMACLIRIEGAIIESNRLNRNLIRTFSNWIKFKSANIRYWEPNGHIFQVIAAGRPYALHNCSTTEMSAPLDAEELNAKSGTGLIVRCLEGYDGGLPIYSYQLEVVADEDGGPILLNKTMPASPNGPTFEVAGLTTGRSYRLFLYAINAKGRSEPAILEPVTLKGVAMYTTGEYIDFLMRIAFSGTVWHMSNHFSNEKRFFALNDALNDHQSRLTFSARRICFIYVGIE